MLYIHTCGVHTIFALLLVRSELFSVFPKDQDPLSLPGHIRVIEPSPLSFLSKILQFEIFCATWIGCEIGRFVAGTVAGNKIRYSVADILMLIPVDPWPTSCGWPSSACSKILIIQTDFLKSSKNLEMTESIYNEGSMWWSDYSCGSRSWPLLSLRDVFQPRQLAPAKCHRVPNWRCSRVVMMSDAPSS